MPLAAPFSIHSTVNYQSSRSGNLTNTRRLDDGRSALPLGKTRSLVFVGVHAAELLAICIVNGYQPVVMLPPPVLAKSTLLFTRRFLRRYFRHSDFPVLEGRLEPLSQVNKTRASTIANSHVNSITTELGADRISDL